MCDLISKNRIKQSKVTNTNGFSKRSVHNQAFFEAFKIIIFENCPYENKKSVTEAGAVETFISFKKKKVCSQAYHLLGRLIFVVECDVGYATSTRRSLPVQPDPGD